MMYYIESPGNDPHFNLALEQYVFDQLDKDSEYFMLWQNDNAIIVGKHQNTVGEINAAFVKEHDISVVRRLSGGGAVYHDMGNLNFTFIVNAREDGAGFDFASFCSPVAAALASLGVAAEINGRNDMTIGGKKFSGNSQYMKKGRVMHHGTIMYDCDLEVVSRALQVSGDKLESKGIQSVRSRVTNVKPHMPRPLPMEAFYKALREYMFQAYSLVPYRLTPEDLAAVKELQSDVYDRWSWNYGASPAYSIHKERRVEGCGKLEVFLDVERQGIIRDVAFYGDYFSGRDADGLIGALRGCALEETALRLALENVEVGEYFHGMDNETFLAILTR